MFKVRLLFIALFAGVAGNLVSQTYTISQGGTISACTGTFYDSGGSANDFGLNEHFIITLCPSTATCISLTFSQFDLGFSASTLSIYNGSTTAAPLLGTFSSTSPGSISANTSGNGCLTLEFTSDPSFAGPGWAANISCVNCTAGPAPSVQDCPGAIPICQNVYSTTASYTGEGNIPGEINTASSCLGSGELNDVWYTFTVGQTGNLNFNITPVNMNDDYDWAIYNLTTHSCADIFTDPSIEVSCNFSGTPGITGANGGSTLTSQNAAGTPDNALLQVTTGETYVVNISNFSSTSSGYTLDFGQSTANIFDNVPPVMQSVNPVACNATSLQLNFSENILCSSVQTTDFTVTGPGGPYTVTAATSPACASGSQYDNVYTLTVSPAFATTGTYTVCLIGGSGSVSDPCSNSAVVSATTCLNFSVVCGIAVTANGGVICNGGSTTISATPTGGTAPFTYTWNPNVGTGAGPISVSPTVTTTYTVTIVDGVGNTATDTALVSVNANPVAAAGNDTTVCAGASVTLHGSGATTYQWTGGPATANYTVSPLVTTTYTLTAYNGACSDTETVVVHITPGLTVALTPVNASCHGLNDGSATSQVSGGAPAYTYSWNTIPVQTTANATGLLAGSYTLLVTDQSNCTNTQTVTITEPPLLSASIAGDSSVCSGNNATITASAAGGTSPYTYTWSNGLNPVVSQTVTPASTTTYSLTLTDNKACTANATFTVNVLQKPTIAFTKSDSACVPLNASFTNATQNATSIVWKFGDGTVSSLPNPVHVYSVPGWYNVTLIATNNGCTDSLVKNKYIHVFPQSHAALTASPATVSELSSEIIVTNLSTAYDTCKLYFGDSTAVTDCMHPSHIYAGTGVYTITLITVTDKGCNDTARIQVMVEPETTFYIPEAYTPNEDGHNDVFMAYGTNIKTFEMYVYDRWGNLIYSSDDINKGWDGKLNGNKLQEDVYVYKIKYSDYKDRKKGKNGRVTLIR